MPRLARNPVRALLLAVFAALSSPAAADPIRITSGLIEAGVALPMARLQLVGADFQLTGTAEALQSSLSLVCTPCPAGSAVDLAGSFLGPRAAGSAVVDGISYPEIFLDGMTGTFSSPPFQVTGAGNVTISRPFAFSGTVRGYVLDPFVHGFTEPAFAKELFGQGTASATFLYNADDTPLFFATDLRYEFSDAAPIPEPATILLLGTGAAAAALRRRRGRP